MGPTGFVGAAGPTGLQGSGGPTGSAVGGPYNFSGLASGNGTRQHGNPGNDHLLAAGGSPIVFLVNGPLTAFTTLLQTADPTGKLAITLSRHPGGTGSPVVVHTATYAATQSGIQMFSIPAGTFAAGDGISLSSTSTGLVDVLFFTATAY